MKVYAVHVCSMPGSSRHIESIHDSHEGARVRAKAIEEKGKLKPPSNIYTTADVYEFELERVSG